MPERERKEQDSGASADAESDNDRRAHESVYDSYGRPKGERKTQIETQIETLGDIAEDQVTGGKSGGEKAADDRNPGETASAQALAAHRPASVRTLAEMSPRRQEYGIAGDGEGSQLLFAYAALKLCLITITLILFVLLIITFLGLIIPEAETVKPLLMDFVIGTVICLTFAFVVVIAHVSMSPRVVRFDAHGVTIGAKLPGGMMLEEQVPWQSIARVSVRRKLLGREPYVVMQQFPQYGDREKAVRWKELCASVSLGSFINALKTWAPGAVLHVQLPQNNEEGSDRSPSYTELWLRYFSSPARRDRLYELPVGHILGDGRYQVVGIIGGGGQGTTYLAGGVSPAAASIGSGTNPATDLVALKEYILPLHRGTAVLEQTSNRLTREASILQRVRHDQIVKLLECFVEDYRGYLVLEYVNGKSLKQLVLEHGAQPEKLVIDMAVQLCEILDYLHGLSPPVVHRDLTPDNLILEPNGQVKLVDFNVAQQIEQTTNATVVGKHAYVPPEQFRGKATPQSDIYALGCTLFYLLTAKDPEPITTSYPRQVNRTVSEALDAVVARATYLDPALRFRDAFEFKNALAAISGSA